MLTYADVDPGGADEAFSAGFQVPCRPAMPGTHTATGIDACRPLSVSLEIARMTGCFPAPFPRGRLSLSLRRKRDVPEQSGACSGFRLAQPLLCDCVVFEGSLISCVNRSLRRRYASCRATGNSLGADEFSDHGFVIATNGALT
jgi:hypothetical protein